ncbi:MAG: cation:proton antiporter [Christensenellaceae bacterium]
MTFLGSLGIILLLGLGAGWLMKRCRLPALLGMLIVGIVIGPYALGLIAPSVLDVAADLRQFALVVILSRAGLSLDLSSLKQSGVTALLLCFLPATAEIVGYLLIGPCLLGLSGVDALLLGTVMAAVSPAVVVPRMLRLKEEGYGGNLPQVIMAGASVDDVFVILLFSSCTAMAQTGEFSLAFLWRTPVSILLGVLAGVGTGFVLACLFRIVKGNAVRCIVFVSLSCLLLLAEELVGSVVPFSALLAVMAMGTTLRARSREIAEETARAFNQIWTGAEVVLFVLVGAAVDPGYALASGGMIVLAIALALCFRAAGTFLCFLPSRLTLRERCFGTIAYLPKATVQAAIGAIPLAMGLASGQIILSAAVWAICLTAPLGAFAIDMSYPKLLTKTKRT